MSSIAVLDQPVRSTIFLPIADNQDRMIQVVVRIATALVVENTLRIEPEGVASCCHGNGHGSVVIDRAFHDFFVSRQVDVTPDPRVDSARVVSADFGALKLKMSG